MIRSHFPSAIALGALLAAAPAFAATSSSSVTTADQATSKPLCSSFKNPNAGKLADKDTGKAREHSASPVHMDCIPDSASGPSAADTTPSSSASANYGGLRDTTSNAQSSMPSTASSSTSSVYNGNQGTQPASSGVGTTTPKMSGDRNSQ